MKIANCLFGVALAVAACSSRGDGRLPSVVEDAPWQKALLEMSHKATDLSPSAKATFRRMLETKGWPTRDKVGEEGVRAAFDIASRAAPDFDLQEFALHSMLPFVGREICGRRFAYFNDSVELAKGNQQQFGTHFVYIDGKVQLENGIDKKTALIARAQFVMPSLENEFAEIQQKMARGQTFRSALPPIPDILLPRPTNGRLHDELVAMRDSDQAVRRAWREADYSSGSALEEAVSDSDKKNTRRLLSIVKDTDFPDATAVGIDGVQAAFLILQHSEDIKLMRTLQPKLERLMLTQQLSRADYAMFLDRFLVSEGRPQLYGTQVDLSHEEPRLFPIADSDTVDRRRNQMGLVPLAEYLATFQTKNDAFPQ